MHLSRLDFIFWAATSVGHIALLGVLVGRGRVAQYPIFTTLIAANIARTITLYFVFDFGTEKQYSYTYWSLAILDVALQFGVVYELAVHTFRPLGAWARDLRSYFAGLICLSLVVAGGLTWLASPPARKFLDAVVIKGIFFCSVCMIELFVGMLALSTTAGLPWRTHASKISQGLGVYSMVCVLIDVAHNYFGIRGDNRMFFILSHIRVFVYLCCLCFWIAMLWPDEPPSRQLTDEMRLQLSEFRRRMKYDLGKFR